MTRLGRLLELSDDLAAMRQLLWKLRFHHESQAKGAPPCTTEYHEKLAREIREVMR